MDKEQLLISEQTDYESSLSRLAAIAVHTRERLVGTAIYVGGLAAMVVLGELEHRYNKKHGEVPS